jgi:hypothetical protein
VGRAGAPRHPGPSRTADAGLAPATLCNPKFVTGGGAGGRKPARVLLLPSVLAQREQVRLWVAGRSHERGPTGCKPVPNFIKRAASVAAAARAAAAAAHLGRTSHLFGPHIAGGGPSPCPASLRSSRQPESAACTGEEGDPEFEDTATSSDASDCSTSTASACLKSTGTSAAAAAAGAPAQQQHRLVREPSATAGPSAHGRRSDKDEASAADGGWQPVPAAVGAAAPPCSDAFVLGCGCACPEDGVAFAGFLPAPADRALARPGWMSAAGGAGAGPVLTPGTAPGTAR